MTWEQMLEACETLGEVSLKMRKCGDWYVCQLVEVKDGMVLRSKCGNGITPEQAVKNHWKVLTKLKSHEYIVLNAMDLKTRRAVKWNGFMWALVEERWRE